MYQSKIDANITIKRYKNHYSYIYGDITII